MASYSKVTRHGQVTLPASVRKRLGISEGDLVEVVVDGEKALLLPKKLIDSSQAYFWTEEWQKAEKEASADVRAGRVRRFDAVDDLLADLDS
jgi:AbrB family looped-hinge helix DNA binding protein